MKNDRLQVAWKIIPAIFPLNWGDKVFVPSDTKLGFILPTVIIDYCSRKMGIQGLLPLLKSIMVPIHIKDLEGCSVAVDTYSWLHKGALSCSKELCNVLPTSKYSCFLLWVWSTFHIMGLICCMLYRIVKELQGFCNQLLLSSFDIGFSSCYCFY